MDSFNGEAYFAADEPMPAVERADPPPVDIILGAVHRILFAFFLLICYRALQGNESVRFLFVWLLRLFSGLGKGPSFYFHLDLYVAQLPSANELLASKHNPFYFHPLYFSVRLWFSDLCHHCVFISLYFCIS